ncbi:MAG: restriction endonuclease subunit S [Actinomycetota bacterium]|nr:restriction endonuclease subunit S [Actinomycetota bacterium]
MRPMKDSGIEWIGEIPEGWEVRKIKDYSKIKSGDYISKDAYIENGIYDIIGSNGKIGEFCNKNICKESIIVGRVGAVGSLRICNNCWITDNALIIEQNDNLNRKYLFYCLGNVDFLAFNTGTAQPLMTGKQLSNTIIPFPSLNEQLAIADYLDKKCELIDTTIEKQKTVIEKLKSYKQSLITEAVTKGLDPNVKMKSSGIEWIEGIPEGWEVKKLKYLGELNSNGVDKKIQEGEKLFKSVHYVNVYNNSLREINNNEDYLVISATDEKANSCTLLKGDVLLTNSSETPDDMGHSTVIFENLNSTLFGYHLMRFRPKVKIYLQFEKYLFGSYYMRKWFEYYSTGITRYGVSYDGFSNALIILPPFSEQQAIADYLDAKCSQIDNAINIKQKLIDKLADYKKSLIYECVTGKKEVLVNA